MNVLLTFGWKTTHRWTLCTENLAVNVEASYRLKLDWSKLDRRPLAAGTTGYVQRLPTDRVNGWFCFNGTPSVLLSCETERSSTAWVQPRQPSTLTLVLICRWTHLISRLTPHRSYTHTHTHTNTHHTHTHTHFEKHLIIPVADDEHASMCVFSNGSSPIFTKVIDLYLKTKLIPNQSCPVRSMSTGRQT